MGGETGRGGVATGQRWRTGEATARIQLAAAPTISASHRTISTHAQLLQVVGQQVKVDAAGVVEVVLRGVGPWGQRPAAQGQRDRGADGEREEDEVDRWAAVASSDAQAAEVLALQAERLPGDNAEVLQNAYRRHQYSLVIVVGRDGEHMAAP